MVNLEGLQFFEIFNFRLREADFFMWLKEINP
jgi:hypothetical protein